MGKPIVQELVAQGFRVTVLSRSEKQYVLPNIEVKAVDYNSFDSLKKSVEYLKTRYEMANETVPKMYDELQSLRETSQNGFKGVCTI